MEVDVTGRSPEDGARKLAEERMYERHSLPMTAQERHARNARQKAARLVAKRARKARRANR